MFDTIDTESKAAMLSRAGLDALGHDLGDALLAEAQARLQSVLPAEALSARVGSRFPVLLPGFALRQVLEFAGAVRSAFARPLQALGFRCELGVHIGIALAPLHGDVYSILLRKADVALYQAQDLGISVGVYDPRREPHTPERLSLLGELRSAAERGDLKLYCQPKIDMRSGEPAGAEALVRWHHPERGMILPTEFVPLLESTDLIMLLTEHMLRASARQSAAWLAQGRWRRGCAHRPTSPGR
jgi:predicted signal transduction protein with EAL and GGDEF domain